MYELRILFCLILGVCGTLSNVSDIYSNDRSIEYFTNTLTQNKIYHKVMYTTILGKMFQRTLISLSHHRLRVNSVFSHYSL